MTILLSPVERLYDRVAKSSPRPDHESRDSKLPSKTAERHCGVKRGVFDSAIITWPLALHCLGSLAIAGAFLYWLDGRHFHIERKQLVPLVNGTYIPLETEWYRSPLRVQPDVTTLISALLRILALIADAWAASLCWRVVMFLAEKSPDGINRGEIEWITGYGALPPRSHFRRSLNPILGLILLATLARNVASPILTGSVAWIPSSLALKLQPPPTIPISGVNTSRASFDDVNTASIPINLASILNTAWGTKVEGQVFKRVVPAAGPLHVGSKISNVSIPYFSVTNITWLSADVPADLIAEFKSMVNNTPHLGRQMSQSGAVALLASSTSSNNTGTHGTWSLLLNVVGSYREHRHSGNCDLNHTVLTNDPQVPYQNGNEAWGTPGCFAAANISFIAGYGVCRECQVSSKFTVQATLAELELVGDSFVSTERALEDMPVHVPSLAPLLGLFPDPANSINNYTRALLLRSYSALWNAWTDAADPMSESRPVSSYRDYYYLCNSNRGRNSPICDRMGLGRSRFSNKALNLPRRASQATRDPTNLQSEYRPAFPTLQARIDKTRVYVWLGIQLLFALAGLAFLFLQAGTCTAHITDTGMLAFDIDSGEAPKPNRNNLKEIPGDIFDSALKVFATNKDTPIVREHASEVMLKAIYDPERDVWKIVVHGQ